MSLTISFALIAVLLAICTIATLAAVVERGARAAAWRTIALERRVNGGDWRDVGKPTRPRPDN